MARPQPSCRHIARSAAVALYLSAAVVHAWTQAPAGKPGRALAIEDYYRVRTVGSPSISPNGKWVVYTVATRIEEDNRTRTETYVVESAGSSAPRRVEHDGRDVGNARWTSDNWLQVGPADAGGGRRGGGPGDGAPDGRRWRWKIDPERPADRAIDLRADEVLPAGAALSADGKWMAQAVDRPQDAPAAPQMTEFERRHQERFKGAIFDWKDFQRDGAPFPAPNLRARPAARVVIAPVTGGESKPLTDGDLRPESLAWHPDGTRLVFIADAHWRDELRYEQSDLWTVTVDGTVTRLTDDPYIYDDAGFSPDGKYISYLRGFGTDMVIEQKLNHGGPRDLLIRPVGGGEPINLTGAWDLEPVAPRWAPDSRHIYFTAAIGGETHLFRVPVPAGKVEQVTKGERRIANVTIDRAFSRIAYTAGVHDVPPEVYTARIDGTDERKLTSVHADLTRDIAFTSTERLRWPSYDGTMIEGWLTVPFGYDARRGPYPLVIFSHGGPHAATGYSFDFKKHFFAANGYFVLDTNFRSSTGYGEAFKWATWGEWGTKDGQDVMSGLDHVLKRYPIDPARVGHTGHSYGGFMTNWLITQYPDRLAAAITGAGISNWISDYGTADIYRTKETEFFGPPWDAAARERMIKQSPLTYAGRVKTPTLFVHGEVDQRVPYEEAEQMYFALKRRGVPAKMIRYDGQPHGIGGHWNNVHRMLNELAWWNRYLEPASGPTSQPASPDAP